MANWGSNFYHAGTSSGTTVSSGASSATATLPADATGGNPRAVLMVVGGSSTGVHVRLGNAGVVATANDLMVTSTPIALNTRGYSQFAYIQEGAAAKLTVAPLEDG